MSPMRLGAGGLVLTILAAIWFAGGDRTGAVAGSVLLLGASLTGALRAELAADGGRVDPWAACLLRHTREVTVYLGLAVGASAAGVASAWAWAAGALAVYGFLEAVRGARWVAALPQPDGSRREVPPPPAVFADPRRLRDPTREDATLAGELLGAHTDPQPKPARRRARWDHPRAGDSGSPQRMSRWLAFTQGERFVVLSVAAVAAGPRVAFIAVIAAGAAAAVADLAGLGAEAQ